MANPSGAHVLRGWKARRTCCDCARQPGVTGWSQFGSTQVAIDKQEVPVLGLQRELGSVEPPTTSGHRIAGPGQIELGISTLRQLGKHVGDQVMVGTGQSARKLTIVGTVTLPSFGLVIADHVSLGRGAMLPESTLVAVQGLTGGSGQHGGAAFPALPSAVAIDMAAGSSADARRLVSRFASADPDGTPGGIYSLPALPAGAARSHAPTPQKISRHIQPPGQSTALLEDDLDDGPPEETVRSGLDGAG